MVTTGDVLVRGHPSWLPPHAMANGERPSTSSSESTYTDTYTLAYRLTGNEEDARDVVQEAYLRAYRGVRQFRGDAQFSTWLYRITANCASTHVDAPAAPPARPARRRHAVGRHPARGRPAGSRRRRGDRATSSKPHSRSFRRGSGRSWCSATSTTFPMRRSPPSSASRRRPPRFGCTGPGAGSASRCSPVATPARSTEVQRMRCDAAAPRCWPRPPRGNRYPAAPRGPTSSTVCGARPTSRSTAGCTGASASWPTGASRTGRLGRRGARRARRGEHRVGRRPDAPTGRDARGHGGGDRRGSGQRAGASHLEAPSRGLTAWPIRGVPCYDWASRPDRGQ